jgi:hypothetical protein
VGTLSKRNASQKASPIQHARSWSFEDPLELLCSSDIADRCLSAFYTNDCNSFGSLSEECDPLRSSSIFQCFDAGLCPGVPCGDSYGNSNGVCHSPAGANITYGQWFDNPTAYGDFPAAELVGTASVLMPPPPSRGWTGIFAFGDTFEVKQTPLALYGCSQVEPRGAVDTLFDFDWCGLSEYGDASYQSAPHKFGNFNWIQPIACYDAIKGPAPTGDCNLSNEFLMNKTFYDIDLVNPTPLDDPELHFMAFSVQEDGSLFWTSSFGVLVSTVFSFFLQHPPLPPPKLSGWLYLGQKDSLVVSCLFLVWLVVVLWCVRWRVLRWS